MSLYMDSQYLGIIGNEAVGIAAKEAANSEDVDISIPKAITDKLIRLRIFILVYWQRSWHQYKGNLKIIKKSVQHGFIQYR